MNHVQREYLLIILKDQPWNISVKKEQKWLTIAAFSGYRSESYDGNKDTISNPTNMESKIPTGSGSGEIAEGMKNIQTFQKILKVTHVPQKKRENKAKGKETENDEEIKEKPIDEVSDSQDRKRKRHKTTEYFYLLERKALRMMRRYYKEEFEQFASKYKYKQNLKRLDRPTIDIYYKEYVQIEFARNELSKKIIGSEQLVEVLETIILCDRYNKEEQVTEGLNFDQVRNLLNKYNSKNLKDFFEINAHAFLYAHYYRLSAEKDVTEQGHVDQDKLSKQMRALFDKSVNYLPDSIKQTVTKEIY